MNNKEETDGIHSEINFPLDIPKEEMDGTIEIEIPYNLLQYLSSENSSIHNLCRICLSVQQNMTCLFTSSSPALHDMLAEISSIQASLDDGLPSRICEICEGHVISYYNFKLKCDKSEFTLKSLLKGEFLTKENQSTNNTKNRDETADKINIKNENVIHEETQFLEALSDDPNDEKTLCIIQKEELNRKTHHSPDGTISSNKKTKGVVTGQACSYCDKKFKYQKALAVHVRKRHMAEEDCHPCQHCKDVFRSQHDLHLHSALHSKGQWKCNKCFKEFKLRSMLRRHVSRHMESKRYTCGLCNKSFAELYSLRRHERVHTGEEREKKHVCHICGKRYSESNLLTGHMASHSGLKPWQCSDCRKRFASARLLASHRAVHSAERPHACLYCDRRFRHESTRNTHHRTHTGDKPYVCAACGKRFIQSSNLRLHMRTHTGERPYWCGACGARFASSSALRAHRRSHERAPREPCACCGKRISKANLRAHMRLHKEDKPYKCNLCPKAFVTATRLRDHSRIHTGEKPFECAICTKTFTTKTHLRKHTKYHENEQKRTKTADNKKNITENTVKHHRAPTKCEAIPLEVTGELVVPEEQTEILVVDNNQCLQGNICLDGVTYVNDDVTFGGDGINLVAVDEEGVSISSAAMLEGATVKLYQIDQSLVQIHSTGAQVTISKITSKMTANF
ncbi:zinc finger protein ZFP2 [Amyelois transitella]|uniref:zinc finger protein ZFP2 n=1 Tax=Amyelois transitella TaxID=680683 RepID=UPI00298FEDB9|nr:zinc finger protein ZFP2 [Amyelois transitella]